MADSGVWRVAACRGGGVGLFGTLRNSVGRYTDPYARSGGLPNTGPASGAGAGAGLFGRVREGAGSLWSKVTGGAGAAAAGAGTVAAGTEAATGAATGAASGR
ncbi:hypothetical protein [Bacillus phage BM-P1]|nr:hypothetical protein [Bacillus phage BM-P1]